MPKRRNYQEEANKLAAAIDLAVESFEKYCPKEFDKKSLDHTISCYEEWKEMTLNPEPKYKSLASLKYQIESVFTYFQEATGETVEYFWKKLQERNLGYERVNKLEKILNRGKIKGRIEYDYVKDMIFVAEQVGLTSKEESSKLSEMLDEYEKIK